MKKQTFGVLFISAFASLLGLGIIAPLMPAYAQRLGAGGIGLGIIFSAFAFSRGIFTPIIGRLSDKLGRRIFMVIGLLLYSIISLFYPLAGSLYSLTLVRLAHGFSSAMIVPIAMAYVGEISEDGMVGKNMGTFSIALFLGMGSGPFIGGLIGEHYGISAVFYAMFLFASFAFLTSFFFLPDIKNADVNSGDIFPFRKIMKDDVFLGLFIFRFVSALGRGGVLAFLPIFASKINITPAQVGILLTVNICLTGILQRAFGRLADRYNEYLMIFLGSVAASLTLFFIPLTGSFMGLLLISVIMGLSGAVSIPSAMKVMVNIGQDIGMGVSSGLFNTAMSAGMVFAPILSGIVMDLLDISSVFYAAGAISLIGTFIFYFYTRGKFKISLFFSE